MMRFLLILCLAPMWVGATEPLLNFRQYLVEFEYYSFSGTDYFDTYKQKMPIQMEDLDMEYKDTGYRMNVRYGATPHTTLVLRGQMKDHSLSGSDELGLGSDGFESYYVGVQMRKSAGAFHSFQMNIGYWGDGSYDADEPLPLGGGEGTWELSTSYFFSLNPYHAYALFDMGYRFSGGDLTDEWIMRSMFSYEFSTTSEFQLKYESVESTESTRQPFDILAYPNERGYQKAGIGLRVGIGRKLIFMASYEKLFRGRNIFQTSGYKSGFAYYF